MNDTPLASALMQFGLTNAALVTLMAIAVFIIGRWNRNVHLQALLWMLVILKLVAPPLLPYTYVIEQQSAAAPNHRSADRPQEPNVPGNEAVGLPGSWNEPTAVATGTPEAIVPAATAVTSTHAANDTNLSTAVSPTSNTGMPLDWTTIAIVTWLAGTTFVIVRLLLQGRRFRRLALIQKTHEPSAQLAAAFETLCTSMTIQRRPRLRIIDARLSPMAWRGVWRTTILFPAELTERLSLTQQQMILAHELAHVRRGDLTVRWCELFAQSVYWWFVPLRWIRSRLHAAQESCCDAMVNRHFPDQQDAYGATLLAVAQWLTEKQHAPAWATSFGRPFTLRQRIKDMLEHPPSPPLSRPAWTVVVMLGLLASTFTFRWAFAAPLEPAAEPTPTTAAVPVAPPENAEPIPESSVTGRVLDPAGQPIEGVWLIVRDNRNLFGLYGKGLIPRSDAVGHFDLGEVAPGRRRLTAFSPDWALQTQVVDFPSTEPVEFTLQKGHRVEFQAIDVEGQPVSGIKFHPEAPRYTPFPQEKQTTYMNPHSSYLYVLDFLSHRYLINNETDENGHFVWENAPADTLHYQIYGKGYLTHPGGDFGPDGSPHVLVFRERISVSGRVIDAETGEPIDEFEAQQGQHFKSNSPGTWSWSAQNITRESPGQFADLIRNLGRTVRYRVDASGYLPAVSQVLDPESIRGSSVSLEFALQKDTGFRGTVLTPNGKPAVGASLSLVLPQSDRLFAQSPEAGDSAALAGSSPVVCDELGRFQLPPQNAAYDVLIAHESGYQQLADIELMQKSVVSLRPWSAVRGRILLDGKPAANLPVTLKHNRTSRRNSKSPIDHYSKTVTDAEGRYHFDRRTAGEWRMHVVYEKPVDRPAGLSAPGRELWMPVNVPVGQVATLSTGDDSITVTGRVQVPEGLKIDASRSMAYVGHWVDKPVRQLTGVVPASLRRTRISSQSCPVTSEGTFRFINVSTAPGEHIVSFSVAIEGMPEHYRSYTATRTIDAETIVDTYPSSVLDLGEIVVEPSIQ